MIQILKIQGGNRLNGTINCPSAKNAILPIIAGAVMTDGDVRIRGCSRLTDTDAMLKILRALGASAEWEEDSVIINCSGLKTDAITSDLTGKIRSSVFILGPLVAKHKRAVMSYPGGCEIGLRPIDLHLYGLRQLGVKISEQNGFIVCDGTLMRSGEVNFDFPSVGATENVMMAASLLGGQTVIRNAAREPEIVDLAQFINAMGGSVAGAGTDTIIVNGVKKLHGCDYQPLSDRIVGGTYLMACAVTGGDITVQNLKPETMRAVIEKLARCGCTVTHGKNFVRVRSSGKIKAIHKIETQPFPGFPTDLQPQIVAMLTKANGCSMMVENLFESRYKYTTQLNKMGARITVKDRVAVIKGVKTLKGAPLIAEDLRGGAALVVGALGAEGESTISGVENIDRGYYHIEKDFSALGAYINRIIL